MNEEIAQEILQELLSSLEGLETQTAAILQFLNDQGIAKKEDIASYLEQAGQASSIRWRAARARIDHLVSAAMKTVEQEAAKESPKLEQAGQEPDDAGRERTQAEKMEEKAGEEADVTQKVTADEKPDAEGVDASAKKDGSDQGGKNEGVTNERDENNQIRTDVSEKAA